MRFGDRISVRYVMAGLYRELDDPAPWLRSTLDALAASDMPGDARVWLDRPPRSTYPAGQAVKAASEQGLDGPYLRVLREAILVHRRAMDLPAALLAAAATPPETWDVAAGRVRTPTFRVGEDRYAAPAEVAWCDLPLGRAQAELFRLATEWRARFDRHPGGELWSAL